MSRFRIRLRKYQTFAVIICMVALVWFSVSMSDIRTFSYPVPVRLTGIDTVRYAVMEQDTVLPLELNTSGFSALLHGDVGNQVVEVRLNSGMGLRRSVATSECIDSVVAALGLRGVKAASSPKDSLSVLLSERQSRRYRPSLSEVQFSFAAGYAISGVPTVEPDEVVLYGSEASLSQIDAVEVENAFITDISATRRYMLTLKPVWEQYPDVRPSVTKVSVCVPVASYTEKSLTVPLRLVGVDTSLHVRLYPENVSVTFWVTTENYERLNAENVTAEVRMDAGAGQNALPVVMAQFPAYARIKQVQPTEVQYVIIH